MIFNIALMIEDKIKSTRDKIVSACRRSGLDPAGIIVVGVTKTVSAEKVSAALKAGIRDIGESRIQEAAAKFPSLELTGVKKHLIGHLQTNKSKKAVELFDVIQSLDRLDLAKEIDRHAKAAGKVQECLLEIKVSDEATKFGIPCEEAEELVRQTASLGNIRITGLMTMAPFFDDPEKARPFFRKAKKLYDDLKAVYGFSTLSMGMSGDFEIAVEEGANMVRIGTAIFK